MSSELLRRHAIPVAVAVATCLGSPWQRVPAPQAITRIPWAWSVDLFADLGVTIPYFAKRSLGRHSPAPQSGSGLPAWPTIAIVQPPCRPLRREDSTVPVQGVTRSFCHSAPPTASKSPIVNTFSRINDAPSVYILLNTRLSQS